MTKKSNKVQAILHKASSNRKLYVFLFCLVLSIFFWLLNALSKTFTTNVVFNVNYVNQPVEKVVLNELPNQLEIEIKGLGFDLMAYKLRLKLPQLSIDLKKLNGLSGKSSLKTIASSSFLTRISNQLGEQIEIKDIYPDSIFFLFDNRVDKEIKIIPNIRLNFRKQYQLDGRVLVKPAITRVSGPASIIDTIEELYTEEIILNDLSEVTTQSIGFLKEYEQKKMTINPEKVLVHVPVEKFTESSVLIKIDVVNLPDSIEVKAIPDNLKLKFLLPLSKMSSLTQAKFIAEIDFNEIEANFNHKLKVKIVEYPDYIKSLHLYPEKVEYILKKRR